MSIEFRVDGTQAVQTVPPPPLKGGRRGGPGLGYGGGEKSTPYGGATKPRSARRESQECRCWGCWGVRVAMGSGLGLSVGQNGANVGRDAPAGDMVPQVRASGLVGPVWRKQRASLTDSSVQHACAADRHLLRPIL